MTKKLPQLFTLGCIILASLGIGYFIFTAMKNDRQISYGEEKETSTINTNSSHSLTPVVSNQWYSTLYKSFPSNPLYAFPLSYKVTKSGLAVSYPTVKATEKTIFAGFDEDFTIGFPSEIEKPTITSIGDWNITVSTQTKTNEKMSVNLVQGSPSYTLKFQNAQDVKISSPKTIAIYELSDLQHETNANALKEFILKINEKYYYVHLQKESKINYAKNEFSISSPETISVALLDKPEHASIFQQYAETSVIGTSANYTITDNQLLTHYGLQTTEGKPVLLTLFPHQYKHLEKDIPIIGEYTTLRGNLKLVAANGFTTALPLRTPDTEFTKATTNTTTIVAQLKQDIAEQIKEKAPDSKDYYFGTWIGKVANLILLADAYGLKDEKQKLLRYITPIYLDSLQYFSYSKAKTSLLSTKPEFGNDELNDHHFHYGYFIRLGAILLKENAVTKDKITPTLNEMVNDIANTDRSSSHYPYLRNFTVYEGHSWADGFGDTPDGNNQESTSEAINAWYSIYLWGNATGDKEIETAGLYLYNTEITSALQYWFNIDSLYQQPYAHKIASIVWGGKVDFATWFSGKANMIYGIQILPITPASNYLKEIPDFSEYEKDLLHEKGGLNDEWADLYLMWKSYTQPVSPKDIPGDIKPFDRDPKSLLLHIISQNTK